MQNIITLYALLAVCGAAAVASWAWTYLWWRDHQPALAIVALTKGIAWAVMATAAILRASDVAWSTNTTLLQPATIALAGAHVLQAIALSRREQECAARERETERGLRNLSREFGNGHEHAGH